MRKKILVTGGAGYIGSHTVVELYLSGYMPIIIDNLCNTSEKNITGINQILKTNIPLHKVDCTDLNEMKNIFETYKDIYACIHFAAYKSVGESVENPKKYYKNNIGSTEVLLKCLEKNKFKNLIFSSSCTVYGIPDTLPVNEDAPFKKAEMEILYDSGISKEGSILDIGTERNLIKVLLLKLQTVVSQMDLIRTQMLFLLVLFHMRLLGTKI